MSSGSELRGSRVHGPGGLRAHCPESGGGSRIQSPMFRDRSLESKVWGKGGLTVQCPGSKGPGLQGLGPSGSELQGPGRPGSGGASGPIVQSPGGIQSLKSSVKGSESKVWGQGGLKVQNPGFRSRGSRKTWSGALRVPRLQELDPCCSERVQCEFPKNSASLSALTNSKCVSAGRRCPKFVRTRQKLQENTKKHVSRKTRRLFIGT